MMYKNILAGLCLMAAVTGCNKDNKPEPPVPVPPAQVGLLKDIVYRGLPSPYFHFVYTSEGDVSQLFYQSGQSRYEFAYTGKKISEMRHTLPLNKEKLVYKYEDGVPSLITYLEQNGLVSKRCYLSYYPSGQLQKLEWEKREGPAGFIIERTVSLTYYADGNLNQLTDHRHTIWGQQEEVTYMDHFENYDDKTNVDGFTVFQKIDAVQMLLPGIVLQKNNPRRLVRSGGGHNYEIDYTYTYNNRNQPVTRIGDAVFTNDPDKDTHFQTNAVFSYY